MPLHTLPCWQSLRGVMCGLYVVPVIVPVCPGVHGWAIPVVNEVAAYGCLSSMSVMSL